MKRTPLRKISARKKLLKKEVPIEDIYKFFSSIWSSIPFSQRECRSCGKPLTDPIRSYYFDHLIEKSKRPDLAYEPENIFLCCLECHALKTDGHPTEKHKEAIEKAKETFGIS